jgi:hypothetical protein
MSTFVRGGPVIAIDVTQSVAFEAKAADGFGSPSDARRPDDGEQKGLVDRLKSSLQGGAPNFFETLVRCQHVHHVAHIRSVQKLATLYLAPNVQQFGLMSHRRARDIARVGHDQTFGHIQTWWSRRQANLSIVREARQLLEILQFEV